MGRSANLISVKNFDLTRMANPLNRAGRSVSHKYPIAPQARFALAAAMAVFMLFAASNARAAIALLSLAKTSSGPSVVPGTNMSLNMPSSIPAGVICVAHLATSGTIGSKLLPAGT
jgi:hypothetical protein